MISREEARAIASRALQERGLGGTIRDVLLSDEIAGRQPILYGVPLEECWIARVEREEDQGVRSSLIVVIRCEDGVVLYCGSANDEG